MCPIEWLSAEELQRWLRAQPPIGVWLRGWFYARMDLDPRTIVATPAETQIEDLLGEVWAWSGFAQRTPFTLRSGPHHQGGFGLEVMVPVRHGGARPNLEALAELLGSLPGWRSPYFDHLPNADEQIARADIAAMSAFLDGAGFSSADAIGRIDPWIVVGPPSGPYISWLETSSSIDEARRLAARWAAETGQQFDVRTQI